MSDNWYYAKGRQRLGPLAFARLRQLAAAGLLMPADMVWNEGASYWAAAGDVPGLFPAPAPAPPAWDESPRPGTPPVVSTEPRAEASGGWDLVERGLLNATGPAVAGPPAGEVPRPYQSGQWEDFGENLVTASAPPPSGLPASPCRAEGAEVAEVRPARPPLPGRGRLDAVLTIAVVSALLAFIGAVVSLTYSFLSDEPCVTLSGTLLVLSGPLFLAAGVPMTVTGRVPYARARFAERPRRSRMEGVAAIVIGMGASLGGLSVLVFPSPWTSKRPAAPPLPADSRRVTEPASPRPLPAEQFHKDREAVLQYRGKKVPYGLWLPPGAWKQSEKAENPAAEVEFMHRDGEAGALVIAERIQMPVGTLKKAVLENLATVDKDARIVHEETRVVNGTEVLCLTMNAKPEGVPVTLHGYFYAGEQGTIQVMTWTGQNLFRELRPELERFLNGFEVVNKGS